MFPLRIRTWEVISDEHRVDLIDGQSVTAGFVELSSSLSQLFEFSV